MAAIHSPMFLNLLHVSTFIRKMICCTTDPYTIISTLEEIESCRRALNAYSGIPYGKITGFRSPFCKYLLSIEGTQNTKPRVNL
jgi:hypothetical protein